jgi:hypothetical protein
MTKMARKFLKDAASGDALAILELLVIEFPGLLDGETEVNGADLVDSLSNALDGATALKTVLKGA